MSVSITVVITIHSAHNVVPDLQERCLSSASESSKGGRPLIKANLKQIDVLLCRVSPGHLPYVLSVPFGYPPV